MVSRCYFSYWHQSFSGVEEESHQALQKMRRCLKTLIQVCYSLVQSAFVNNSGIGVVPFVLPARIVPNSNESSTAREDLPLSLDPGPSNGHSITPGDTTEFLLHTKSQGQSSAPTPESSRSAQSHQSQPPNNRLTQVTQPATDGLPAYTEHYSPPAS